MPRYHFNLVDSKTVADQGGAEISDDMQAMDVAEQIAPQASAGTSRAKKPKLLDIGYCP
jgi:hypothetical protein